MGSSRQGGGGAGGGSRGYRSREKILEGTQRKEIALWGWVNLNMGECQGCVTQGNLLAFCASLVPVGSGSRYPQGVIFCVALVFVLSCTDLRIFFRINLTKDRYKG